MAKRNQYKFDKKKYDHIHLQVPMGEKDVIKDEAYRNGERVNAYINRLIKEAREK